MTNVIAGGEATKQSPGEPLAGAARLARHERPKGEPFVWLTAMGLAVGLLMIVGLLAVIFVNGLEVFWPKRVAEIRLAAGSAARIGESDALVGEIVKTQKKRRRALAGESVSEAAERQVFVGNRDVLGFAFRFVDDGDVERVDYPRDVLAVERLEYGDAFGVPVRLETPRGPVPAEDGRFEAELGRLVREAKGRWAEIRRIEKDEIGRLNARMETLRLREKGLERRLGAAAAGSPEIQRMREETRKLDSDFAVLSRRAQSLREEQKAGRLVLRLFDGREKAVDIGQILQVYPPNRLSAARRAGLFLLNLWRFIAEDPREANTEGGVFPAIFGTFVMTVIMSCAVAPFGVLAAIYLTEYAKQGFFVRCVRIAVNNLAGVPSIVFGVFGLGFFVYTVGGSIDALFYRDALPTPTFGTGGILWASLTLALMTVPVVIVATEEAISAVPRGMREGSLACGASKWQTIQRIVLPASAPGIITGVILAMARGAGEVAPLMLVGVVKLAPTLPLDGLFPFLHLERKFMHLGFHIYDLGFQSPDSEAARPMVFATTLLLIVLVVTLNVAAFRIRQHLRKKYRMSAF
jgi:phosphate transport system permease protein